MTYRQDGAERDNHHDANNLSGAQGSVARAADATGTQAIGSQPFDPDTTERIKDAIQQKYIAM